MTSNIRSRYVTVLVAVFILATWVSLGCENVPEIPGEDRGISANEEGEVQNVEDPTSTWPEGWIVVHHEEWLPVLDDLGRRLHSARSSFQNGDRRGASADIRSGLTFLEAQISDASERDQAALERAISTLWVIADRLSDGQNVTLEQLDIAFANAYLSNLEREALVFDADSTEPYLDRPDMHLDRAIKLFLSNEAEKASREIDRASAYLYLEGNRLDLTERAELNKAAQDLEHLSARLRLRGIRDRSVLDNVFEPARQQWRRYANAPARPRSLGLMSP